MSFSSKGIVTSVGYSFAFAALCSLAVTPGVALADEVEGEAVSQEGDPIVSDQTSNAPVASEKSETVYVFTNADGAVKNVEVSTTLKNPDGAGELADSSVLTDIENAESDSSFTGSGKDMVWDAAGENIYYTGNTSKEAPVSIRVSYFLNGSKVEPDKLAGASGHVKIRYDYDNNATVKAKIRGKEETLYVPFTFVTAMLFDNDKVSNIEVTNGKLIDDGDRAIIAGYAMPGLKKSLGKIVDDFDIPEHFEVEADVTDFEMKSSLTIATAGLLEDMNTDDIDTSKLENASSDLTDAMGKIIDGASQLQTGLDKLADGAKSASVATGQLADGAKSASDATGQLSDGASKLADGTSQLADGTGQLVDKLEESDMVGGVEKLYKGTVAIQSGLKQLVGSEKDTAGSLYAAKNGADALAQGAGQLVDGSQQVIDVIGSPSDTGMDTLNGALNTAKALLSSGKNEDLEQALKALQEAGATLESLSGDASAVKDSLTSLASALGSLDTNAVSQALQEVMAQNAAASAALDEASGMELSVDTSGAESALDGVAVEGLDSDQQAQLSAAIDSAKGALGSATVVGEDDIKAKIAEAKGDVEAANAAAQQMAGGLSGLDLSAVKESVAQAASSFEATATKLQNDAAPLKAIDPSVAVDYEKARQIIQGVQDGLNQMKGSEGDTEGSLYAMKNGVAQLQSGVKSLSSGLGDAIGGLNTQLIPGVEQVAQGIKALYESTPELFDGIEKLDDGANQVADGSSKLADGASQLDEGVGKLADGASQLDEGLGKLADGAGSAADGAGELVDGLQQFNDEGIGEITDLIDEDLLPFTDRLDAITQAGKDYDNFAGITKGTKGSVKFIFETDPIENGEE